MQIGTSRYSEMVAVDVCLANSKLGLIFEVSGGLSHSPIAVFENLLWRPKAESLVKAATNQQHRSARWGN